MEYYTAIKKWNPTIHCNIDGPRCYYAEWNKSGKINIIWFHLYAKSKEQKEQTNQKQTHKYRGPSSDS